MTHDESRELNTMMDQRYGKVPTPTDFIKSLKNVKSKVGSFKDRSQKYQSLKKYSENISHQ
jgi:hypothetical protein